MASKAILICDLSHVLRRKITLLLCIYAVTSDLRGKWYADNSETADSENQPQMFTALPDWFHCSSASPKTLTTVFISSAEQANFYEKCA